jgi:outer membrane protein assembly factor BamD
MKKTTWLLLTLLAVAACKIMTESDRISASLPSMSAEELLTEGMRRYDAGAFDKARLYLKFLYENFPNSPQAVEALLKMADAYAQEKGFDNKVEARQRFSDFYSRFPQAAQAEYALFMQGKLSLAMKAHPDKDPANVNQAMLMFTRYLQIFPDGPHVDEAREGIRVCREHLASHEHSVARFYFKRKAYRATLARLDFLKRSFPDYGRMGEVHLLYGQAYRALGDEETAEEYFRMAAEAGVTSKKS